MLYYFLITSLSIGLIAVLILLLQPRWLFTLVTVFAPGVFFFKETNEPLIALTIDDGPDPITTPKILALLQAYGARATFFIISNRVSQDESILTKMVNNGNELGNHLTKDTPSIRLPPEEFESDLLKAHSILSQFTTLAWLRPASGWYNSVMLEIAYRHGYRVALGSIFPLDTHIHSPWFASKHILFNARPGSIIILHDCGSRGQRTARTLEIILPVLCRKGYSLVTLSELFENKNIS